MASRSFDVEINPRVLKWAREDAGVTLEWAADRIDRDPKVLQAWESDVGNPTFVALRELANLYRRPMAVLMLADPPEGPKPPTDRRSIAGRPARQLGFLSITALREAHRLRDVAGIIFGELDVQVDLPVNSAKVSDDPEVLAQNARGRLGVSTSDQGAWASDHEAWGVWRAAVENSGALVFQFKMPLIELRGFSLSEGPKPPAIVVSSVDRYRPRLFTLFHEYAHLLLGAGALCRPTERLTASDKGIEAFCNAFAGALLVPRDALLDDPGAQELKGRSSPPADEELFSLTGKYRVSRYVIWERLFRLGMITREAHQKKWAQWSTEFEDWSEPEFKGGPPLHKQVVASHGSRFTAMLIDAGNRGLVNSADVADYLGIQARYFDRVLEAAQDTQRRYR